VRDLAAGAEHALTAGGFDKTAPEINPGGTVVAWREASIKRTDIFLTPFGGGAPTKLCAACQSQVVWSADGGLALVLQPVPHRGIGIVDVVTGRQSDYMLDPPGLQLRARAISRDNEWLAFSAGPSLADYRLYVAPFAPDHPPLRSEWIEVARSPDAFPSARWSPDGNLLYFGSGRDGYGCLWAQRLNPRTKRPEGEAFAVQHFHQPLQHRCDVAIAYRLRGMGLDAFRFRQWGIEQRNRLGDRRQELLSCRIRGLRPGGTACV
jgi:hypothetical protein